MEFDLLRLERVRLSDVEYFFWVELDIEVVMMEVE